jgi:hypothetical protein
MEFPVVNPKTVIIRQTESYLGSYAAENFVVGR